jgi:hypothetical protein
VILPTVDLPHLFYAFPGRNLEGSRVWEYILQPSSRGSRITPKILNKRIDKTAPLTLRSLHPSKRRSPHQKSLPCASIDPRVLHRARTVGNSSRSAAVVEPPWWGRGREIDPINLSRVRLCQSPLSIILFSPFLCYLYFASRSRVFKYILFHFFWYERIKLLTAGIQ